MKNTTKTIALVLAVFLVAALFVGGASAATGPREVAVNGTAFVYEHITIAGGVTDDLVRKSGDATPVVLNRITYDSTNDYYNLLEASVGTQTGVYYIGDTANTVSIYYPQMSLKGYIGADGFDSFAGKSVDKNTEIRFVVESQYVGANGNATVTIFFTTPVAGKTSVYGITDFANLALDGVQKSYGPVAAGTTAAAGSYVAQAEFVNNDILTFYGIRDEVNYKKSNTVSFTLQSPSLTLTADKDSVVRSNPFTVTIQGDSLALYFVFLDGASTGDVNPTLQPSQSGMVKGPFTYLNQTEIPVKTFNGNDYIFDFPNDATTASTLDDTSAYFRTDASGKRTVQYNTLADTDDKTYTIKVVGINATDLGVLPIQYTSDNDKVKVKVEKGAVTITASGDRTYYIGEEIKLTGTNTDSGDVFLFITGPNLAHTDGIQLKQLPTQDAAYLFRTSDVAVKTDNTWEYKWDTSNCGLDTGAYTIYATSVLTNGKSSSGVDATGAVKLSDSEYATVSVSLKQPFLSATPSGTYVAKGDKMYIRGTAEGDPTSLMIYIFGPNKFEVDTISVEDDGTYEYKLEVGSDWASNQYFIVIEHPMYNGKIDVKDTGSASNPRSLYVENMGDVAGYQASFIVAGTNKLQGSNAADALTKMIDSANIDDIYTKLTITVQEPWIRINNPGDQAVGTTFTVSGTTNLAVDDQILVEIASSSFTAIDKSSTSTTSGYSQSTKVVAGDGVDNAWSIEVDSTNFKLDEYTIKASGIEADVTTTTNFNIVEKIVVTATQTTATTAPVTTTAPPQPTEEQTPGFGAFIALAGLGAVALLVLRRN